MSFGLGRGRALDDAPGAVGVAPSELGPIPDEAIADRALAHIDPRAWFSDPASPLEVEIGTGKGAFLIQQARLQPETNFLGVEWAGEFYLYAADRIRRWRSRGMLDNVRMLRADATEWLAWRVPPGVISVLHLYFSDPWPKARHHKKRVVRDSVLADAWRALTPGAEIRIVTDHDDYWAWMEDHFARWTSPEAWRLLNLDPAGEAGPYERLPFDRPASAEAGELVGTNFERKYRREGRPFHACVLRKT
ncbi:MAG: tRNA (guanine(46)-N(7))-methyltransferase TrmB [Phycisphaerales bacterium JB039]